LEQYRQAGYFGMWLTDELARHYAHSILAMA
jgi:hypothetical protein